MSLQPPRLPALASPRAKLVAGAACTLYTGVLYIGSNRWHGAPAQLPLTTLDEIVPFLPATGWLYAAAYLLLAWAFFGTSSLERVSRWLYALAAVQTVAAIVFVAWPVAYPRELAVLPAGTHPIHAGLVDFWRRIDAPVNCLPSLHVTSNLLALAMFTSGRLRRWFVPACVLAVLSIASTLTFKQHYAVDLLAGLALATAAYVVFFRWVDVGPACVRYATPRGEAHARRR